MEAHASLEWHRNDRWTYANSRFGTAIVCRVFGCAGVMASLFIRPEDEDVLRRVKGAFMFLGVLVGAHPNLWIRHKAIGLQDECRADAGTGARMSSNCNRAVILR